MKFAIQIDRQHKDAYARPVIILERTNRRRTSVRQKTIRKKVPSPSKFTLQCNFRMITTADSSAFPDVSASWLQDTLFFKVRLSVLGGKDVREV